MFGQGYHCMRSSTHQSRIEDEILPAQDLPHTPPSTSTRTSRPPRRPPRPKTPPNLRPSPRTRARRTTGARIPQPRRIRRLLPRPSPQEPPPAAGGAPRQPSRRPSHSASRPPTTTPRRPGCGSSQAQLLALEGLAAGLLAAAIGVGGAAVLGGLLVLDGFEVAGGAGPVFVQEQALVVLGLREDAGPGVEEGRGVCYGLGDGLCVVAWNVSIGT